MLMCEQMLLAVFMVSGAFAAIAELKVRILCACLAAYAAGVHYFAAACRFELLLRCFLFSPVCKGIGSGCIFGLSCLCFFPELFSALFGLGPFLSGCCEENQEIQQRYKYAEYACYAAAIGIGSDNLVIYT